MAVGTAGDTIILNGRDAEAECEEESVDEHDTKEEGCIDMDDTTG
jgi:hypothetical protein